MAEKPRKKEPEKVEKASKSEIIRKVGEDNKSASDLRADVAYVQHGVTFGNGKKGSYIWYKHPSEGGTDKDRDEVYEENMPLVNQMGKMRKYNSSNPRMKK